MSWPIRIFLFASALILTAAAAALGLEFTYAVDGTDQPRSAVVFCISAGLLFASPLWFPALIPNRFPFLQMLSCCFAVVGTVLIDLLVGSVLVHQIIQYSRGYLDPLLVMAPSLALLLICSACLFLQLRIVFAMTPRS